MRDRGSDCESVATKHEPGTLTNCLRQSLILSEESRERVSEREQKIETVPNKRSKFEKKWIFLLIATSSDDAFELAKSEPREPTKTAHARVCIELVDQKKEQTKFRTDTVSRNGENEVLSLY